MREKIARFMVGRYGTDYLNRFLTVVSLVLALFAIVLNGTLAARLAWLLAVAALVTVYCRMLSRNVYKRRSENAKYMSLRGKVTNSFRIRKERWVQRKNYKFFKCSSCGTMLRVPRGKGKINIVCRRCGNSFQGKS